MKTIHSGLMHSAESEVADLFFVVLFLILFVLMLAGLYYLATRFHRFSVIERIALQHPKCAWLLSFSPMLLIVLAMVLTPFTTIVVVLHLIVFWAISDGIAKLLRRWKHRVRKGNPEGIAAICATVIYFSFGFYYAHHVYETSYSFTTQKAMQPDSLRVVFIADAHLGVTLDGDAFAVQMERIQKTNPDLVIVAGDFVDDNSERVDMERACEALGTLDTTYGVYYSFGNHDEGYAKGSRDFTVMDLRQMLTRQGVIILEDETVQLDTNLQLIGRLDRSAETRLPMSTLMAESDEAVYTIVVDHQPNDYAAQAQAGADLVLSGHTHGGHIFPAGPIGVWIGANDRYYGTEHRAQTDFIVTSGISGWAIPFKTGAISEYVVIDITKSL